MITQHIDYSAVGFKVQILPFDFLSPPCNSFSLLYRLPISICRSLLTHHSTTEAEWIEFEKEQAQAFENLVKEQKEAKEMTTAVKEAKDVILGEIQKGDKEKVVVSLKEYQGHKYVDVRIHFKTDTGMWQFTKKGITLNPAKVKDLVMMLQKV